MKDFARSLWRKIPEPARNKFWKAKKRLGHQIYSLGAILFNKPLAHLSEAYLRKYYRFDTERLWTNPAGPPEWFDHRADLYRWSELRIPFWVERGVFSREVMFENCRVLDLCCGDGFYAHHFYSGIASFVDAVDIDPAAIRHARRYHNNNKIRYYCFDIYNDDFPAEEYDIICWDAAIEHFSQDQIRAILKKCAERLNREVGVLSGYTIVAQDAKGHPEHLHEFSSASELQQMIRPFFPFVGTLETKYPERSNLYFRAAFQADRIKSFA